MPEKLPTIPDEAVVARLAKELPGWYLENGWIRRKYSTDGWPTTLMLVNAIGFLSEAAWHHPDLEVTWGKIWVKLKTHSAGGITDRDFSLAKEIEALAAWRPAPGSAMEGTPNKWVTAKKER
jgi:4a-hydroxytetrahydrobiopterin dehydratase